jgi:hypothetical protein
MVSYVPALAVLALMKFGASASWACGGFILSPMPSRGDDGIELKFVMSLQWVSTRHGKYTRELTWNDGPRRKIQVLRL